MTDQPFLYTERIKLLIRPNSSKTAADGMYQDRIKIKVNSPPEKGKANKALIEFISKTTGISKKDIRIISGHYSNLKEIEIKKKTAADVFKLLLGC